MSSNNRNRHEHTSNTRIYITQISTHTSRKQPHQQHNPPKKKTKRRTQTDSPNKQNTNNKTKQKHILRKTSKPSTSKTPTHKIWQSKNTTRGNTISQRKTTREHTKQKVGTRRGGKHRTTAKQNKHNKYEQAAHTQKTGKPHHTPAHKRKQTSDTSNHNNQNITHTSKQHIPTTNTHAQKVGKTCNT